MHMSQGTCVVIHLCVPLFLVSASSRTKRCHLGCANLGSCHSCWNENKFFSQKPVFRDTSAHYWGQRDFFRPSCTCGKSAVEHVTHIDSHQHSPLSVPCGFLHTEKAQHVSLISKGYTGFRVQSCARVIPGAVASYYIQNPLGSLPYQ